MKTIPLTNSDEVAIVDDEDFEWLSKYKWCLVGSYVHLANPQMHSLIYLPLDGLMVDHINGYPLDNRKENLRYCTFQQNQQNRGPVKDSSSRYKGVSWYKLKEKWHARIKINNGQRIHLGYFDNEKAAARAYDEAAKHHFGEFVRLNFPENPDPLQIPLGLQFEDGIEYCPCCGQVMF